MCLSGIVKPLGYSALSSAARTVSPALVVVAAMVSTITSWVVSDRPRQFIQMWATSRCSTLFHLLVPGGRWHTVIVRPVVAARRASPVFHSRVRYPLEPPPSALITRREALGYMAFPIYRHQVAMVAMVLTAFLVNLRCISTGVVSRRGVSEGIGSVVGVGQAVGA